MFKASFLLFFEERPSPFNKIGRIVFVNWVTFVILFVSKIPRTRKCKCQKMFLKLQGIKHQCCYFRSTFEIYCIVIARPQRKKSSANFWCLNKMAAGYWDRNFSKIQLNDCVPASCPEVWTD